MRETEYNVPSITSASCSPTAPLHSASSYMALPGDHVEMSRLVASLPEPSCATRLPNSETLVERWTSRHFDLDHLERDVVPHENGSWLLHGDIN